MIKRNTALLALLSLVAALPPLLRAQTTQVLPNAAASTWDTTSVSWATTGAPTVPAAAWTNGNNATITSTPVLSGVVTVAPGGVALTNLGNSGSGVSSFVITGGSLALAGTAGQPVVASWTASGASGAQFTIASVITDPAGGGSSSLTKLGSRLMIFTGNNTYTGDTTIGAGTLQVGAGGTTGAIAGNIIANNNLTFNRSDIYTYSGVISGTSAWTQAGAGTLILTGDSTNTGNATINAGATLQLGNGGVSGSLAGNIIDKGTLIFNRGDIVTYGGVISTGSGSGSVTLAGTGTVILTGANTYNGGTTINAGTLQLGAGGTTGIISGAVANNSALIFNRADAVTYNGIISGTGTLTQSGAGTLIFTATNTYSGGTTISAGTLQVGNAGLVGSIAGNVVNNAALVFNRTNSITFGGDISGTGTLAQTGLAGTLILTGNAAHTGGTTVASGTTLQIGNAGAVGSVAGDIADAGALVVNRSDTYTYSGKISGAGTLTQAGTGTLVLTAAHPITGLTTVSTGTLRLGGGSLAGAVSVASGAALEGNGAIGGDLTLAAGAGIHPGAGTGDIGTLTVAGSVDLSAMAATAGALAFDLDAPGSSDKVAVTGGTLTLGSGVVGFSSFSFNPLGNFAAGTYTLMTSATPITGTLAAATSGTIGSLLGTLQLTDGGTKLSLVVATDNTPIAPLFTTQPQGQTVTVGATVTFTAAATGRPDPDIKWQKNGGDIPGATGATLTLVNVTAADAATYRAVATNSVTTVTSNDAVLTVNKATPVITWSAPTAITYGTALSATQLNASSGGVAGTFVYSPAAGTVLNAGVGQALSVTFTPTDTANYTTATGGTTITISKATPVITWSAPSAITYGTALSATQLNATSGGVAGTFAYTPASGTQLNAGTSQALSVSFTPTDTANYNAANGGTTLTVNKATPVITWSAPTAITYGTALSATQLNASSGGVAGTFVYSPAAGTVLNVGVGQALSVTFSPTDSTNYNSATSGTTLTVSKATPVITWSAPASIPYGTQLSATQLNASSGGVAGTFAYTPAAGTLLSIGDNQALSVTFTPTDTVNYNSATGGTTLNVIKATPVLTWPAPADLTYGTALSATQLNATSGGVAGTFVYSPAAGTVLNAGIGQILSVTFTPTDTSTYNSTTDSTTITVQKATPLLTWTAPTAITYGTALSGTQLNASSGGLPGALVYAPAAGTVLNAGVGQTLGVTFTPTDTSNYNAATTSTALTVNKATPVLTWAAPAAITYGTALSAIQLNVTSGGVAGTFAYAPASGTVLNAGPSQPLGVTFTPTDAANYTTATTGTTITVNKATPLINWPTPSPIALGTALSAAQLNATSGGVAGTFVYSPAAGTVLGLGNNQALGTIFTPTDTANFNSVTTGTTIDVNNKIVPTITWTAPAAITYGAALSATQLNATSGGVAGTFVYTPAAGTVLNAGAAQILSVTFTPTDTVTYNIVTTTTPITVNQATPTLTWTAPVAITYGTALSSTQLTATSGGIVGTFAYTPAAGTVLNAGAGQTLSVTFTPDDATNYQGATKTTALTVNKATPVITWSAPSAITYGTALSATQLNAVSGGVAGTFAYMPAAGTVLNAGASQALSVSFMPTDTANYNTAAGGTVLTVSKATPVITWSAPTAITYGAALSATQLNASSGGVAGTFAYTPAAGTQLNAGASQALSVSFTPIDTANYNAATGGTTLTVSKATPVITWSAPSVITYGTALSATQLNATSGGVAGTFAYTPASGTVLNAGASQALSVSFAPADTANYNTATGSTTLSVGQATPVITWSAPAAIISGTALSATQLNASSGGVAGTFAYTPAAGTVLSAGAGQTLSVTFTPTDSVNYTTATGSAMITVNTLITPTLNWPDPAAIAYGTVLSATQLNASSGGVAGTFAYTPAAGTQLNAGPGQTLSVTFTPTDSATYASATVTQTITVSRAALTVRADDKARIVGAANPALTLSYTGFVAGETAAVLSATPTAATTANLASPAGVYPITLSGGSAANYTITLQNGTLTVAPANYAGTYFGTFASGGNWALYVRGDNTATYIAYLPARHSVVVTTLSILADGTFSVTGTEIKPASEIAGAVNALELANPEAPTPRTPAATGDYTLSGAIAPNGAVTGQLGGLGESLTGAVAPSTGSAQAVAGLYTASALGSAGGSAYLIVAANGQAVAVTTGAAAVDGASGTVSASGQLTATTGGNGTLTVTINSAAQTIGASLLPAGSSSPVSYAGLPDSVPLLSRVVNFSVRTVAGTGDRTLIVGFVVGGAGSKTLLLRGVGPGLLQQGVVNALADPAIRVLSSNGTELSANNDWGGRLALIESFNTLGAFALAADSKDAGLLSVLPGGLYSLHVTASDGGTGVALAELYDGDALTTTANVVNVSARAFVGTGENVLIGGFVVSGNAPRTILIRGLGPTLASAGVGGVLTDPQLQVFQGGSVVAANDNWAGTPALKSAFATVGAGALASDSSKDAALLVTLQPGVYSAQVSGVGSATGVGLVEIFVLP